MVGVVDVELSVEDDRGYELRLIRNFTLGRCPDVEPASEVGDPAKSRACESTTSWRSRIRPSGQALRF